MRNFQQKRGWRSLVESKPVLILLGIFILFFAWNILGFYRKMQETEKNKNIVEDKITELTAQKQQLLSDTNSLNTDEGKEKLFRDNFRLAKDGEEEIVIVDDKTPPVAPPKPSSGFFSFFNNLFK